MCKNESQKSNYISFVLSAAIDSGILGEKTAFACKGTALELTCPKDNEVIKVTRANYGRFSIAVCNEQSMTTWSVNCFSPKARNVFQTK